MFHTLKSALFKNKKIRLWSYAYLLPLYQKFFLRKRFKHIIDENELYKKAIAICNIKSGIAYDAGSYNGQFIDLFYSLGFEKIVALEPHPFFFEVLHKRYSFNSKVIVIHEALYDSQGQMTFRIDDNLGANSTLSDRWYSHLKQKATSFFEAETLVETTTLDILSIDYGKPSVLKMDIEGSELPAIRGLSFMVPLICMECNLPVFLSDTIRICEHILANYNEDFVFFNLSKNEKDLEFDDFIPWLEMKPYLLNTSLSTITLFIWSKDLPR